MIILTVCRLILYYPVSALVTLFANILQNPQDARARGDLRLMSSVCSFLTMLERETSESNGNVRRMLSVCREFERIASVVLDKAEREMRGGRGKRKATDHEKLKKKRSDSDEFEKGLEEGKSLEQMQVETQASYRRPVQTPSIRRGSIASDSPPSWPSPAGGTGPEYKTPSTSGLTMEQQQHGRNNSMSPWNPPVPAFGMPNGTAASFPQQPDFSATYGSHPRIGDGAFNPAVSTGFTPDPLAGVDMSNAGPSFGTSPDLTNATGSFQQPFVPQDLWQMPMTLEWDWAEGLGLGSFAPGPMFDAYQ